MKKCIVVAVFCAAFLLFFISHARAGIGLENREPGKFYFERAICGEIVIGTELKILCFEPHTDISGEELQALTKALEEIMPMVKHSTSWLTVVKFKSDKIFIRLSDGYFIYASGSGSSFANALKDLVTKFSNLSTERNKK